MKNTNCYLCNCKDLELVEGKVQGLSNMKILKCGSCGLVFLESFDHIDSAYYGESKMRLGDPEADWKEHLSETDWKEHLSLCTVIPLILWLLKRQILNVSIHLRNVTAVRLDTAVMKQDSGYQLLPQPLVLTH